jgi:hypothetical protein
MKLMARLMRALPMQTTTNLAELASAGKPQVETDSTYRRLQRFFAEFSFGYETLGRFLLDLVPTDPPYVAVLDRTEWHFGQTAVNVLMIGIAEGGIAYPVTWSVLEHGGGSGAEEHTELLRQFLRLVEPDELRAFVGDREFTGSDFLKALDQRGGDSLRHSAQKGSADRPSIRRLIRRVDASGQNVCSGLPAGTKQASPCP